MSIKPPLIKLYFIW